MFVGPRSLSFFFLLLSVTALSTPVAAQDPIRVETNQVLVPVVVYDKRLFSHKAKSPASKREFLAEYSQLVEGKGLGNFGLFEDGKRQSIQTVTFQPTLLVIHDSLGKHAEIIGSGGGRWAYPDRPESDPRVLLPFPQYLIAYAPPPSPEGSCHQILVTVDDPNIATYFRNEYCNTKHSPSDPLMGTEFGKDMENDLTPGNESKIDLKLQAVSFYKDSGAAGVYLELEFPWQSLKHQFRDRTLIATIGILGMIYRKDGSLAARFSDFACCYSDNSNKRILKIENLGDNSSEDDVMIPNRYATQIDLPPGQYDIRAVLSDGEKFGRAESLVTLDTIDGKPLAVSQVFLARRIRRVESPLAPAKLPEPASPFLSDGIEYTPTANPHFRKDEQVYAFFEAYTPQASGPIPTGVQAHMRILDAKTGDGMVDFDPVDAAPYMRPDSALIPIGRGVKLANLPSRSFSFEVSATDSTGVTAASSTTAFTVGGETVVEPSNANATSLAGWRISGSKPKEYEAAVDADAMYKGHPTACLKSKTSVVRGFGTLMQDFSAGNYAGRRIRFSANVKAEGVRGWAGLWMRVDKRSRRAVAFDNMQDRPVTGTTDWRNYTVVLDVPSDATRVSLGLLLAGSGTVWLNNVKFEGVGSNVPTAGPKTTGARESGDEPRNLDFTDN